jgi:DNA-binding MarR family transcriptional regulator
LVDVTKQSDELLALGQELVAYAGRLVRAARRGADPGTPMAGIRVLALLDDHGPLGVSRLAQLDPCSQPTMSGTVAALEARGWVTKSPHPGDARANVVSPTADGTAALHAVRRRQAEQVVARLAETDHEVQDLAAAVAVLRDLTTHR